MPITRETLRLQQQLRDDVAKVTDVQVRDLVKAWATAWDEVSVDLEVALTDLAAAAAGRRITRALVLRTERLTRALTVVQDHLQTLAQDAGGRITADIDEVVRRADTLQAAVVASQLPAGERALIDSWARVDGRALDAIVRRSTQQITARTRPLSRDAMSAVRRELVRGTAQGLNPLQVARHILGRTEGAFNGGLTRATAIARTEVLDAHREAARQSRAANTDLLAGWVWHSELSERTCPACWAEDGSLHPADEAGPNDHVNGRCTALPQLKSWADLGFDMVEPRSIKPDARTTFVALPAVAQQRILGPGRWAAWQDGRYPINAWSTTRSVDGWRDSIAVTPVPTAAAARRLAS